MQNKTYWVRVMIAAGIMIVLSPLLIMVLASAIHLFRSGFLVFDYLLPAELFPLVLIGGLLLLAVSLSQKMEQRLVGLGLAIPVLSLMLLIGYARLSGMDSSPDGPGTVQRVMIGLLMATYIAGLIVLAWGGIKMNRRISVALPASPDTTLPE